MEPASDVMIFTAADAKFFRMCLGLVLSLLRAAPVRPRIRVLDLGLTAPQRETLEPLVEAILPVQWHATPDLDLPSWFRAFTVRPCLPRYVEDADILMWIDADVWVQDWSAVASMIEAARGGAMAIVEVEFGPGVRITYEGPDGKQMVFLTTASQARRHATDVYRQCFGEAAVKYGGLREYNGGVWALRRNSPSWAIYAEMIEQGLSRSVQTLAEQQGLNLAIRTGRIPVATMPQTCNYTMNQGLPAFDTKRNLFVFPKPPRDPIGVLHFTHLKRFTTLMLPRVPQGGEVLVPIHFLDWVASQDTR